MEKWVTEQRETEMIMALVVLVFLLTVKLLTEEHRTSCPTLDALDP